MTQQSSNNNKGKVRQNGKKYLIYAIMVIVFLACMWFIFAPSGKKSEAAKQGSGFNSEIPDPRGAGIVDDKKTAYEQEQIRLKREQQMNSLRDYSYLLEKQQEQQRNETPEERAAREERQLRMAPKPIEYYENPERFDGRSSERIGGNDYAERSSGVHSSGWNSGRNVDGIGRRSDSRNDNGSSNPIRSSASANAELTGSLVNFFEEPKTDTEKDKMAAEIARLNEALAEKESAAMSMDDQLALMERSYQLAAKYTGGQSNTGHGMTVGEEQNDPDNATSTKTASTDKNRKTRIEAVTQVRPKVVSSLSAPLSDAEFVRRFAEERNHGFNTVGLESAAVDRNTIAAVVHGDQTLTDGRTVRLRTVEPMQAGKRLIPSNTIITGIGRIAGERLEIAVTAIEHEGAIINVELTVRDSDGQAGIHIPGSMEIEALKEIAGNMGQGLGSTINLNQQSAGAQLLTDLGRGAIQGTSQYISKKARQVKVTLKAGYRIFLMPETNS